MRRWEWRWVLVALVVCAWSVGTASAQYLWRTIKIADGPFDTLTWALNDQDLVVGDWAERDNPVDPASGAFRYQRTFNPPFFAYTIPGASWLRATGINEARDHAGYYLEPCVPCGDGSFTVHGFLRLNSGEVVILDFPDPRAFWTFPMGLNDMGQVVGGFFWTDEQGVTQWDNFLWQAGIWTVLPRVNGAVFAEFRAINNHGELVGFVVDPVDPNQPTGATFNRGIVRSGGIDWRIDVPGASATFINGINDHGQVVGEADLAVGTRGWLLSAGTFTVLNGPQGRETFVTDINNTGNVVGYTVRLSDGYTIGIHGTLTKLQRVSRARGSD